MNEKQQWQLKLLFEAMITAQAARKVYQDALTNLAKITRDLEMEARREVVH